MIFKNDGGYTKEERVVITEREYDIDKKIRIVYDKLLSEYECVSISDSYPILIHNELFYTVTITGGF